MLRQRHYCEGGNPGDYPCFSEYEKEKEAILHVFLIYLALKHAETHLDPRLRGDDAQRVIVIFEIKLQIK